MKFGSQTTQGPRKRSIIGHRCLDPYIRGITFALEQKSLKRFLFKIHIFCIPTASAKISLLKAKGTGNQMVNVFYLIH